ncbi:MAG TPA: protein TolQ [Kofleriaceae bacterium]|nr:protein TolQ [Kofleriaceae bacterium]
MEGFLALVPGAAGDISIWSLISDATLVVKLVMGVLLLMSIICWYIVGYKYWYLRRANIESAQFTESFWRSRDIEHIYQHAQSLRRSPISVMFLAGYTELAKLSNSEGAAGAHSRDFDADMGSIERALRKAQMVETTKLESMVPFLATTGSAGPFIGLFGTVWGIMHAFLSISQKQKADIRTVAPGIAEALIATAIGLVAAIPAVMAYNYCQRKTRVLVSQMETFTQDYLNIIRRHFLK